MKIKKRYELYVSAIIALMAITSLFGQRRNYATSLDIGGGYAEDGIGIMASYNYHVDNWSFFQVSVFGSTATDKGRYEIPYTVFTVQPGFFRRVWEQYSFKRFALNVGGGGLAGYEVVNKGNNQLENGALINGGNGFIYGAFIGAELEIRVADNTYLMVKANEHFHINSDVGNFYPYVGAGIRCFLY